MLDAEIKNAVREVIREEFSNNIKDAIRLIVKDVIRGELGKVVEEGNSVMSSELKQLKAIAEFSIEEGHKKFAALVQDLSTEEPNEMRIIKEGFSFDIEKAFSSPDSVGKEFLLFVDRTYSILNRWMAFYHKHPDLKQGREAQSIQACLLEINDNWTDALFEQAKKHGR
jgi:hypothetical protein